VWARADPVRDQFGRDKSDAAGVLEDEWGRSCLGHAGSRLMT
jgi:hypothetical protein